MNRDAFFIVWGSILILIWLKSITIGSEFDFTLWFRYKKHYSHWYFNKRVPQTYQEYRLDEKEYGKFTLVKK